MLVFEFLVLGWIFPQTNSYMVSERGDFLITSQFDHALLHHLSLNPDLQTLGASSIRSDLSIASGTLNRWKLAINTPTLGHSQPWGKLFLQTGPRRPRFAILVWSFQICIFNFQIYIFFICISAIFSDLHYFSEIFWPLGHRRYFW